MCQNSSEEPPNELRIDAAEMDEVKRKVCEPPHQSELNEAARPSTQSCWKLEQKAKPENPGHVMFSTNQ